jgi:hypothetical protein
VIDHVKMLMRVRTETHLEAAHCSFSISTPVPLCVGFWRSLLALPFPLPTSSKGICGFT